MELGRKLLLTSILSLIAPGSAGQGAVSLSVRSVTAETNLDISVSVVVGILLAFCMLQLNLRLRPYSDDGLNFLNSMAQTNLFFTLFVALLLKVDLDGNGSSSFFNAIVGVLCVVPMVLPFIVRFYLRLYGNLEARMLIKDNEFKK